MMGFFACKTIPISEQEIVDRLKEVRSYAWAPYSKYHVATIVEIEFEGKFYYTSGVNVELPGHNKNSSHSEQSALGCAGSYVGDIPFSRMWIMAAPASATPEQEPVAGKSCGHCRQISASISKPNAKIYTVTLKGELLKPDTFEDKFLPDSFSERDLDIPPSLPKNSGKSTTFFGSQKFRAWDIPQEKRELTTDQISQYLYVLSPHIVNNEFKTSPVKAVMAKCKQGYAAGVLRQDIAFLTTDAVISLIANGINQFGHQELRFFEIHFSSDSYDPGQLSGAEIQLLSEYVHSKTMVYFHTPNGLKSYPFIECLRATYKSVEKQLEQNFSVNLEENLLKSSKL